MTSRVSPRSNASSASSSSTSSCRAYRNPTFGKARDNFGSDPWLSDATSAYPAKHQQHLSGGQRSQKSHQTGRDWRDSGPPVAKESENSLPWRSQKPAVNKYSGLLNSAQSSASHQPDDMYQPPRHPAQGQPASHALKSQWSHVSPRQQSLAPQQGRPYFEDTMWGRQDPSTTRWNEDVSLGKLKLPSFEVNRNQGYLPDNKNHSNRRLQTLNFNQCSQLNRSSGSCQQGYVNYPPNSNHGCIDYSKQSLRKSEYSAETSVNHEESLVRRNQVKHRDHEYAIAPNARGLGAKSDHFRPLEQADGSGRRHQEDRSYPPNLNPTSLGYFGNFSRVSESSAESSVFRSQGDAEFRRHTATYRNHQTADTLSTRGLEVKLDHFQALAIRDCEVPNKSFLPTNRLWEGEGPLVTSWADECCDNVVQTYEVQPKSVYNPYNTEWVDSDVATIRKLKHGNDSKCHLDTGVMDRNSGQENSRQVALGTRSRLQNPKMGSKQAKQEASRKTGQAERKGSIKQSASIASDQVVDKAGEFSKVRARSQNEASLGGIEGGQEAVTHAKQAYAYPAETEVSEDTMLPFIMGTCEDMCPVKEREQRERLRDLAVFERVNRNPSKTSRELAVKKFCRTLTGVKLLSVDVRPLRVLWNTQRYLLNLLDDTEFSFDILHNFLFDRTRAIRQELGSFSYFVGT